MFFQRYGIAGLLYQRTIPDSTLGWPSPGWARRRPDPTLKKEIQVKEWECDIDDGDGTGGLAYAKNRESPDLNVETVTHVASGDSRDGRAGTRRGTAGTREPQTRATTTLQGSRGQRE